MVCTRRNAGFFIQKCAIIEHQVLKGEYISVQNEIWGIWKLNFQEDFSSRNVLWVLGDEMI